MTNIETQLKQLRLMGMVLDRWDGFISETKRNSASTIR